MWSLMLMLTHPTTSCRLGHVWMCSDPHVLSRASVMMSQGAERWGQMGRGGEGGLCRTKRERLREQTSTGVVRQGKS